MSLVLTLPWPPSSNTYWRRNGHRYFISTKGQNYRKQVIAECSEYKRYFDCTARIILSIEAYPPDKRKRDLDNIFKSLLDSLQHAEVFPDDSQIDSIYIKRMPDLLGQVVVKIEEMIIA